MMKMNVRDDEAEDEGKLYIRGKMRVRWMMGMKLEVRIRRNMKVRG